MALSDCAPYLILFYPYAQQAGEPWLESVVFGWGGEKKKKLNMQYYNLRKFP